MNDIKDKQKKNILYILNSSSGGATQGIIELLYQLDRNIFEPYIITPNHPNKKQSEVFHSIAKSYSVIRMDWWNKKYDMPLLKRIFTSCSSILKTGLNLITIYKIIKKIHEYDIDIVHTSTSLTLQGAIAAKLTNTPHIWHVRESIGSKGLFKFWVSDQILIKIFKFLSNYITPESHYAGEVFQRKDPKLKVIHDGVDVNQYIDNTLGLELRKSLGIRKDDLLVAMVANLSATMKRHDVFIKMAASLSKNHGNTRFVIFGSHPNKKNRIYNESYLYAENLKNMVLKLKLKDNFIWGGFRQNIPELMSAIDILVHPCEVEGFGRIAIEAMAAGKPVVGPKTGGISETVKNDFTGYLVKSMDVDSFAKATEKLISNKTLRTQFGVNAKSHINDNFSISNHVKTIQNIYHLL